jgi:hypothetical protein
MCNKFKLDTIVEQENGHLYYLGFEEDGNQINFADSSRDMRLIDSKEHDLSVPGYGAVCLSCKTRNDEQVCVGEWLSFESKSGKWIYNHEKISVHAIIYLKRKH